MKKQEKLVLYISIFCVVLGILVSIILSELDLTGNEDNLNYIGTTVETNGEVKIRYGESINWKTLGANDNIYSKSYLFTGDGATGKFVFLDGSIIKLDPNSLIYLDFMFDIKDINKNKNLKNSLKIDFVDGEISFDLKEESSVKKIAMNDTTISINKKETMIKLQNDKKTQEMQVSVFEGDVSLNKRNKEFQIKSGEKLKISESKDMDREEISSEVIDSMRESAERLNEDGAPIEYKRRTITKFLKEFFHFIVD
ncbi:FecR domain-containing protein [Halobacteriovorax sp. JY17]|uniref:FecR domain-containing protein n=1 Tax=Halobacteriovorax sp. JY17 TaxID=2014617 RepID=UPI000C65A4B9|nr:FecR domain-containing protein [Halobacteriovorax sp. JY17]PIK15124.1 MAG: hypothetical protein CES88_10880 [Halobacteriovorax sp. JY17]